jgi:hypothetical protein
MVKNRLFPVLVLVAFPFVMAGCDSSDSGTDNFVPVTDTGDVPADVAKDVVAEVAADVVAEVAADVVAEVAVDVVVADVAVDVPVVVKGTFKAILEDFQSKSAVEGAKVEVLDNLTGIATGESVMSGADGAVSIELEKGIKVGFKVSMADSRDTYQFGIDSEAQDETLWLVSETTYVLAPAAAGLTVDSSKGIVAGGVYFFNDLNGNDKIDDGEEEKVGCATIATDPAGEYRYFNPSSGLPGPIADFPTTSKNLSYVLAGNVAIDSTGKIRMSALVNDVEVGSVDIFSFPESICISNIYVNTATNPTPVDCAN